MSPFRLLKVYLENTFLVGRLNIETEHLEFVS